MNFFEIDGVPVPDEIVDVLEESPVVRIERIVSRGQTSGWFDQSQREFVILIAGEAELEFDGDRKVSLVRGDCLLIEPHQRHRVSRTSSDLDCFWLCVFFD